ncbi:MAG TPA: prohibitin family protein [Candidatus Binataceae bacterium]|nr:prohibitin family protein [Candidatus Binataceae bacterium]
MEAGTTTRGLGGKGMDHQDQRNFRFIGFGALAIFLLIVLSRFSPIAVVPAGHVGVLTVFGRVTGQVLHEGMNFINPLARPHLLSIRTQEMKESSAVPSSEGLILKMDTSLLYHVDPSQASQLYQKVGEDYVYVIVEPLLRSSIREATAENTASALYTSGRELVAQRIMTELSKSLAPRGIVVENVLLRDIQLPETLSSAIEAKQKAEQESLQMQYVLTKEKQEAERKRVEAQGIADFQKIVTAGISDQLLQWKGIEATEKLASSQNTKIVVVGGGKTGLPLILGQ